MFKRNKNDFKAKLEHKLYLARENPEPVFDVSECGLREVPSGVFSLCRVFLKQILLLDHNKLSALAHGGALGDLANLHVLNLQNNSFTHLPNDIALLTNLKELYVNNNKLKSIPSAIGSLVNLRILDLSCNSLKVLPGEMGQLRQLQCLDLRQNNLLKTLPSTLCHTPLTLLKLDADNFIFPPREVTNSGIEAILKFLCAESGVEYNKPSPSQDNNRPEPISTLEENTRLQEKIWEHERLKMEKQKERLKLEKDFEEFHKKELQVQAANKASRLKFLTDITQQQSKLEDELIKIQNVKERERMKLIKKLHDEEKKADVAIDQLLNLSKQSLPQLLEQEQLEDERLLSLTAKQDEVLRKNEILKEMQDILEKETRDFQKYDEHREETAKSVLMQEVLSNEHLSDVLKGQECQQAELVSSLQKDLELQRIAVGALLERSDARSWGLVQQVRLVEQQLATLTNIEMDRRKLQMNEQVNELSDKRLALSLLLIDLLSQQQLRREQLVSTLNTLEALGDNANGEDFWLRQYQQLLDRRPETARHLHKDIDPEFAHELLVAGVIHYMPFLAKWIHTQVMELTQEQLIEAGIKSAEDRTSILQAYQRYKQKLAFGKGAGQVEVSPSAPARTPDSPGTSMLPTAPPETPEQFLSSECVVCMDSKCEIIFIPCGHLCCCLTCSDPLVDCPLCRSTIERKIKILQA